MELPLRPYQPPPQSWHVGYDFGSTNSAAAFCLTSDSIDGLTAATVYPITGYKQTKGNKTYAVKSCEVPTISRYEDGGKRLRWGWDVVSVMARGQDRTIPGYVLELFKPGIDDHESTRDQRTKLADTLSALPFSKTVEEVLSDYMTKHFLHIKDRLRAVGYRDGDNVHLTSTIPALWSLRARRKMTRLVELARKASDLGVGKVSLCLEPQAATAYVFFKCENIQWKEGDTFLVCDAGGVTIDVVTYSIISTSPLRMKEVVKGIGAFCGSSKLNERFKQQVEERLSDETYLNEIAHGKPLEKLIQAAVLEFEMRIKREYVGDEIGEDGEGNDGGEDLPYTHIGIPGLRSSQHKQFESSDMAVTRAHVEAIFRPNLEAAWNVVKAQIVAAYQAGREPGRLLVVGGYGASERLQLHFKQNCSLLTNQLNRRPIKIMVPDTPENAIAEGAIYTALHQGMVEDHVSRSSICITRHDPLDRRQRAHKDVKFESDKLEGRNYVHNCVKVLLKTNQMIPSTGLRETVHLHCTLPSDKDFLDLVVPIHVYDEGNGVDGLPIDHPSNKGFEFLERVSFRVDVRPIRHKLERKKVGTTMVSEQSSLSSSSQISTIKTRRGKKRQEDMSTPSSVRSNSIRSQLPPTPPSPDNEELSEVQDPSPYYFWIEYKFCVEFKDMLMNYQIVINNVDEIFTGEVNLASILEVCNVEDE